MIRIAVLVSGGGSNLQALLDAIKQGHITHGKIELVVSSKSDAYALQRAKNAGIETCIIERKKQKNNTEFNKKILKQLEKYKIDLVVLAGFLCILDEQLLKAYPQKILNIHPSLLPAFGGEGYYGIKVHQAAIKKRVKITGATVHFVNEITDGGEIILQKPVVVLPQDTPEVLQKRVMEQAEWEILPQAVEIICKRLSQIN